MTEESKKLSLEAIPGFPELSIKDTIVMMDVQKKIKEIYEIYGYVPIDTRLVELDSVLNRKGIDSKELYSLNWLSKGTEYEPNEAQRKLALRFDLTVPLARYIGQYKRDLSFPFKRYHIGKVYRAETSKATRGRFNEFYQSDIDVIGFNSLDMGYDSEFPAIVYNIFKNIFNIDKFVIRISNRKLLEGLFRENGLKDVNLIKKAVNVIDNIEKVDEATTLSELDKVGVNKEDADSLLQFFKEMYGKTPSEAIKFVKEKGFTNKLLSEGINELEQVVNGVIANGVDEKYFKVDPRIARGLDYYTGTVYETNLLDHMELGSVCSGGRYNDLVSTLTNDPKDVYPGVGVSIGLSRLVPTLIKEGYLKTGGQAICPVLVTCQDKKYISKYQEIACSLRNVGIKTDIYLNKSSKLPKQLDYANSAGFKYVILGNKYELEENKIIVRNMNTSEQETMLISDVPEYIKNNL